MMTKIRPSAYAASLLVLLAYVGLGCATDPNQAGPSRTRNDPKPRSSTGFISGATEWLHFHQRLFSIDTEPANLLSGPTVLDLIQRMVALEQGHEFKIARRCLQNALNRDIVRQMVPFQDCLTEIDKFVEALQVIARLDETRRAQRLDADGLSVMEQLANLWRLDEERLCQIQSLKLVGDLMVLYQQWPNLHHYISSQLDKRRQRCLTIFTSCLRRDIDQLRASQPIFQLLEKIQLRLGLDYNQHPLPVVYVPIPSSDALYHAVASEIALSHQDLSNPANVDRQYQMVAELRRKCRLIVSHNVVRYYNQFMLLFDLDRLSPITMRHLSISTRHLPKFEICNKIQDQHFSVTRLLDEMDQIDLYEAQIEMVLPAEPAPEPSQENDQDSVASQTSDHELRQLDPEQVNIMPLPESPRVESEEDFYETLAGEVAQNYQRDSSSGTSG